MSEAAKLTRIAGTIQVTPEVGLYVNREVESFNMQLGHWYVEIQNGQLIVRGAYTPATILTVDAEPPRER